MFTVLLLGIGLFLAAAAVARAQVTYQLTTLHTFNGSDGTGPNGSLALGNDGNFYGTTVAGGINNVGTIFRISPAGTFTTLYHFTGGSDEGMPTALALANNGYLYGVTQSSSGTVFVVAPSGIPTTIFTFGDPTNGYEPATPLTLSTNGNLYGQIGEMVFQIDQANTLTTIADFSVDGFMPFVPHPVAFVPGGDGSVYVMTQLTGDALLSFGSVYQFSPTGTSTLVAEIGNGSVDGFHASGLVLGNDGNLYGTTSLFDYTNNNDFTGTVFRLTPAGVLTALHNFTGPDGSYPNTLYQAADGNFYGTTTAGGVNNDGTVFAITPAGVLTTLYNFTGGSDGNSPNGTLVQGSDGSFYGTTAPPANASGVAVNGTIFKLAAVQPPAVVTVAALESEVNVNTGAVGHFQIVREGGDLSQPLAIAYDLSGTALPGVDYQEERGRKFIQPGMTAGRVPIVPVGDLEGRPKKKVRLTLLPGNGYTLGATTSAVITLVNE